MPKFDLWERTVLLVVPDATVRHGLRRTLVDHGMTVFEAPTQTEALDLLADEWTELELLIVDLELPDLIGVGLAQIVRTWLPELPVLLLSPSDHGAVSLASLAEIESSFSAKRLSDEEVVARCADALAGPSDRDCGESQTVVSRFHAGADPEADF